jgi:hypothetical protein
MADFLAGLNPQYSATDLNKSLSDHETQLKAVVDSYAAKDYAKAFTGERTAAAHMNMIGDYLAAGIVKQFQSKF